MFDHLSTQFPKSTHIKNTSIIYSLASKFFQKYFPCIPLLEHIFETCMMHACYICIVQYNILMSGEQVIKVADMQKDMMDEALRVAKEAVSRFSIEVDMAEHIKTHFDNLYSPNWHCIVGRSFATVVTYESRHYLHFSLGQISILLFKFG